MHLCCNDHTQSHIVTHLPKVLLLHLAVSHKSKLNFIANSLSLYEAAKYRYIDYYYCICKSLPWYLVYVIFNGKHYAYPTKLQLCIHLKQFMNQCMSIYYSYSLMSLYTERSGVLVFDY